MTGEVHVFSGTTKETRAPFVARRVRLEGPREHGTRTLRDTIVRPLTIVQGPAMLFPSLRTITSHCRA